jgi:cytochrome c oxidase subunit 3
MRFVQPYHLVEPSPWPITASVALLTTTLAGVLKFQGLASTNLWLGLLGILLTMALWFRDMTLEGTFMGYHTKAVQRGLTVGFLLFVVSEVFFFISWFWGFFHSALAPTVELGSSWPPAGVEAIDAWELPLVNTVLLLTSGATVTWAHHSLIAGRSVQVRIGLFWTILLALAFTLVQAYEYATAPFTISDGVFGSCFFMLTGFHGLHVIVGTIFLIVCALRVLNGHFTGHHHLGFEASILYWHFVDIVWLFLFIFVYWWGGV